MRGATRPSLEPPLPIPTLEFFNADWLLVPAGGADASTSIQFSLLATPPVSAQVGVIVFAKGTAPVAGKAAPWAQVGRTSLDNLPDSLPGQSVSLPMRRGMDYVVRFQGEAHLLMPGFQAVTVGFDVAHAGSVVTRLEGPKTAPNARAAAVHGHAYLRCV